MVSFSVREAWLVHDGKRVCRNTRELLFDDVCSLFNLGVVDVFGTILSLLVNQCKCALMNVIPKLIADAVHASPADRYAYIRLQTSNTTHKTNDAGPVA